MNETLRDTLNRLLAVLDELDRLYRALHEVLESERTALTAACLADFLVVSERKEALLNRLKELDACRVRQTGQLAAAFDLPPTHADISRLAGHLPPAEAGWLRARGERLTATLAPIGDLNGANRELMEAFRGFAENALQVLQGLKRPASTYHRNARMRSASRGGALLVNEV